MGRHDELCAGLGCVEHDGQQAKLTVKGERGFRLVEEVETVAAHSALDQWEERLPVGAVVEIGKHGLDAALWVVVGVDVACHAVERLGSEEPAPAGSLVPAEGEVIGKAAVGGERFEAEIAAAAFGVEPGCDGQCFDDGRFAGAVVADEECHVGELDRTESADGWECERVAVEFLIFGVR